MTGELLNSNSLVCSWAHRDTGRIGCRKYLDYRRLANQYLNGGVLNSFSQGNITHFGVYLA